MAATFVLGVPFHDYTLDQHERAFHQIQHPPNTSLVKSKRLIHNSSTGGACGYFIGELRKYSGSRPEIELFYSNQAASSPIFERTTVAFITKPQDFLEVISGLYGVDQFADWQLSLSDLQGDLYLIYFRDIGSDLFDYRCM